jgi:hypothetical protein
MSARARLMALQAAATDPVETAVMDTSTRKKKTCGIGGRTYKKEKQVQKSLQNKQPTNSPKS